MAGIVNEAVAPLLAQKRIVAVTAREAVIAFAPEDQVVAARADDSVVALSALDDIAFQAAGNRVVALVAGNRRADFQLAEINGVVSRAGFYDDPADTTQRIGRGDAVGDVNCSRGGKSFRPIRSASPHYGRREKCHPDPCP